MSMAGDSESPVPNRVAILAQACQHLWLVSTDDVSNESSLMLTMPSTLAPLRPMLAETPAPRGLGAAHMGLGTLSEGFTRRVTLPRYLIAYC